MNDVGTATVPLSDDEAIAATIRDYYEGWFEADSDRMTRALHPQLVKRGLLADGSIDTDTAETMIDATRAGVGARHAPERRAVAITIDHVHGDIATAHATGQIYVDYLQLAKVGGRWQIVNALWARGD